MKTAKAQPVAWTVTCPFCGGIFERDDGSQILDVEYLVSLVASLGGDIYCPICMKYHALPKSILKELK